ARSQRGVAFPQLRYRRLARLPVWAAAKIRWFADPGLVQSAGIRSRPAGADQRWPGLFVRRRMHPKRKRPPATGIPDQISENLPRRTPYSFHRPLREFEAALD